MTENSSRPKYDLEFYLPDIALRDLPLSSKESFLIIADQAIKVKASGIVFDINTDGKGEISLILGEKTVPILKISQGVFDKYWKLLTAALQAPSSFMLKVKNLDQIYEVAGELAEPESGRKIITRFSSPKTEKDILDIPPEVENA